ncbi:very short patch repair endonuclease [Streptomyces sp. NPDC056159]|uniref:very short patch repair endonuclease n=1 Tax=Streptomyces sp. NPDC056159 TaxID=3155537 RepID=UPI003421C549
MTPDEESWARSGVSQPALLLRQAVHRLGLRFRVDARPLPDIRRTADLVFPRAKVVVFMDGCSWHGCPTHATSPKQNREFWPAKLAGIRSRDRDTDHRLQEAGWVVVRVWEHEDPQVAAERVQSTLQGRL